MGQVLSGNCAKCGERAPRYGGVPLSFPVEFKRYWTQYWAQTGGELKFTCTRCGYQWRKPCADAPEYGETS